MPNPSRSALSHTKTRACFKYFVNDCKLNLSAPKYLYSPYKTTLGVSLGASDLNTAYTILWEYDNPVSKVDDFWKFLGKFVIVKSMQVELLGLS